MLELDTFIREGTLAMIVGSNAMGFAQQVQRELLRDVGLPVIILRASEASVPSLLIDTHASMATLVVVDAETPEHRFSHLFQIADVVIRTVGAKRATIIRTRARPTIRLEASS